MSKNIRDIPSKGKSAEEKDWIALKENVDNLSIKKKPRPPKPNNAITIAVSSRTLFNMKKERQVYEDEGLEKYVQYQLEHEDQPLLPGVAFPFVKVRKDGVISTSVFTTNTRSCSLALIGAEICMLCFYSQALLNVNSHLREFYPDSEELFDIVLMTNNHAQVGVRLINSINHYDLTIERFCMSGSESAVGYLKAYMTDLYLSKDSEKVREAIEEGIAAATMFACDNENELSDTQLRVAFDGDAVLFSDESEIIAKTKGLDTFFEHEKIFENKPLAQGPLKGFLEALGKLQRKFYAKGERLSCPIRTYLVTARSAASAGARVLKTFRSWGLEVDEALFLAGAPKGPLLQKIRPHIFFDDQMFHIEGAQELGTIAAHVPYGIGQTYYKGNILQESNLRN